MIGDRTLTNIRGKMFVLEQCEVDGPDSGFYDNSRSPAFRVVRANFGDVIRFVIKHPFLFIIFRLERLGVYELRWKKPSDKMYAVWLWQKA